MAWQAAGPSTIAQDAQGNYHIKIGEQWMPAPKGSIAQDGQGAYHFNSDSLSPSPEPPTPPAPTQSSNAFVRSGQSQLSDVGDISDAFLTGLINLPHHVLESVKDFVSSAVGQGHVERTPGPAQLSPTTQADLQPGPIAQKAGQGISAADTALENSSPVAHDLLHNTGRVLGDVSDVAQVVAPAKAGLDAIGTTLAERAAAIKAATGPFGMKTGAANPIARNIAGSSAKPTIAAHNQSIADPTLGAQAGVPVGTKITPQSLEEGRKAPNSVYQRAETSVPTGNLSPASAQAVQNVGADDMIVHSPDTQATIDAQKARLLSGPLTGPQVVNAQKTLRFNGFKNIDSEDPEQLALAHAQLKMADALHQHMVDTLPSDAPVSADQLTAARTALAQNHTIENVLGPNGNVNLTKLAKLHNDNPGMLSGPMKDIAQFASDHPEVTRLPTDAERFNPHSVVQDIASINPLQRPVGSVAQLFGGAMARRALTGPKPTVSPPVTGLAGEFGPIERGPPQPPVGMTAAPPTAPPPAAGSLPGQIPLADLLSHGVEQQPAAGLSLASEAPAQGGLPFARNAAHEAGGLEVAPEDAWFKGGAAPDLSDLGRVLSQGVPEDIVQRANNASNPVGGRGANAASLEGVSAKNQAVAKGVQPVSFGADDLEHPMSVHDIARRDLNPAPDSIFIDKKTGEIINSGRMAPRLAQSLLARWKAIHGTPGGLGAEF